MDAPSPTIAAAALGARKALVDHLTGVGATDAASAVTYQPQRHLERRALAFLKSRGVVQLAEGGRVWLDSAAADQWRREARIRNFWVAGGVVAGVGALLAWRRYQRDR